MISLMTFTGAPNIRREQSKWDDSVSDVVTPADDLIASCQVALCIIGQPVFNTGSENSRPRPSRRSLHSGRDRPLPPLGMSNAAQKSFATIERRQEPQ
jgi:hypothetical protein